LPQEKGVLRWNKTALSAMIALYRHPTIPPGNIHSRYRLTSSELPESAIDACPRLGHPLLNVFKIFDIIQIFERPLNFSTVSRFKKALIAIIMRHRLKLPSQNIT